MSPNFEAEMQQLMPTEPRAATMGNLAKLRYSHHAMIDMLIANPAMKQNDLALAFGVTPSWISNIMASDAWQSQYAARCEEVLDPVLKHTIEERMKALVLRSQEVLMAKLEAPMVSDNVALKALELGARSLGMGQQPPAAPPVVDLNALASRLLELNPKGHTYEGKAIPASGEVAPDAQG